MPFECPPWPPDWPEIDANVRRLVQSGQWGQYHSPACSHLQARLSQSFGVSHARLCCSGTAALEIALRALGVGPGDEVILAAYDFPGNFRTVELLGARPVLVDVGPNSPCIDPDQLDAAASEQVKAVIATHLFGCAAPVAQVAQCCRDHGWNLIEDACQVPGMQIDNAPAGSFGDFATLSFGGSKVISAGSGGALLTSSDRLSARLGSLLDRPGDTFPLSPLQAAVIEPQLDRLDETNRHRRETADFLAKDVDSRLPTWSLLSTSQAAVSPAFYKMAWTAKSSQQRNRVVETCKSGGIPMGPGFRSMSRCSTRRCRKPIDTPRSDQLGETLMVMDHRALLIERTDRALLEDALINAHDASSR